MSLTAIGLITLSALLHALWNFFGKKANPTASFFSLCLVLTPVLLLPLAWPLLQTLAIFPNTFWCLVFFSGICQGWYFSSLAEAYRSGDISIVYPLARSSPLIIVATTTLALGQGGVTTKGLFGICLVVVGSILLPMQHFADLRLSNYTNRSTFFAISAAFATAGYSIIDDQAVKLMAEQIPEMPHIEISILYIWTQALLAGLFMVSLQLAHKPWRLALIKASQSNLRYAIITSVTIAATYTLVLWSMQYVENVSYVVAFRQLSIPIGVALGITLLKESMYPPKLLGGAMICVGLVAVALD